MLTGHQFCFAFELLPVGASRISQTGDASPTYYLAIFFLINCMKMKEMGPRVGPELQGRQ